MNKLPQARDEEIVVQHLDGEVLIYDLQTNKAVCLNSTSAIVFNHCDGKTTFDELKKEFKFNDDLIYFTLDKLNESNLLDGYQTDKHFAGLSRREVIKRVGMGSMIALPIISTLIAPSAAHAGSGGQARGTTCTATSQCRSGDICTTTLNGTPPGGSSGIQRCCINDPSVREPNGRAGATTNGVCTTFNTDCCSGTANFVQDPAMAAGRGSCVCSA